MLVLSLKIIFLFLAVLFTCVNTSRMSHKSNIDAFNFLCQAVGITGFITLQWLI